MIKLNKKIIQFGPSRTGTTLIWQILNSIFHDVKKIHNYVKCDDCYRVVTYRDFRDSLLSVMRINEHDINVDNLTKDYNSFYKKHLICLNNYKSDNNVLFLKYELFYNDYNYVYDEIEKYFNITISIEKRNEISNNVSLKKNKKTSDDLKEFKYFDKDTLIHGNHIHHPEPGTWKELNGVEQKHITNILIGFLKKWGYEK